MCGMARIVDGIIMSESGRTMESERYTSSVRSDCDCNITNNNPPLIFTLLDVTATTTGIYF
jgi:hypothetical protein